MLSLSIVIKRVCRVVSSLRVSVENPPDSRACQCDSAPGYLAKI